MIRHNESGVFDGIDNPFEATRDDSLVIEPASLPPCLEVTAWSNDGDSPKADIMAVRHASHPVSGVQFHPESILTRPGHRLLQNFLRVGESRDAVSPRAALA